MVEKILGITFFAVGLLLLAIAAAIVAAALSGQKKTETELLYLPAFVLCCVGLPFLLIGGFFIFLSYRKKRKKQRLMQTGRRLPAEVTGSRMNFNYTVNGRHPYQLECRYTDPATGAVYLFCSYNIWIDPELYVGQQVMVYADPADYGKYYVDVDSLQSERAVYDYR